MSNPIPKIPNADNRSNQSANQTAKNSGDASAQLNISAVQGRAIFGQVNVNLKLSTPHSPHEKEKAASHKKESEVERKTRQETHQGKNSTEQVEKYKGKSEKTNTSANRHQPETAHTGHAGKSNRAQHNGQSGGENNVHGANASGQTPSEKSNNKNQSLKPSNGNHSAEPHNQTNRPSANFPNPSPQKPRQINLTINHSEIKNHSTFSNHPAAAPKNNANFGTIQLNNFLSDAVKQVFRENDVYLSNRVVDNLLNKHKAKNSNLPSNPSLKSLSKEVVRFAGTIENHILQTSRPSLNSGRSISHQIIVQVPQTLDEQIQSAKNFLGEIFGTNDATHFSRLDIKQRLSAAIETLLKDLPAAMTGNLQTFSVKEILDGFLLARGLVDSGNRHSTASLLEMMQSLSSDKTSLTTLRDFGALVKVLISDAAAAKSNTNLETAVGKFARILIAVNCLEAVLTAVKLANQSQSNGTGAARTLAIVQVYELINLLVLAGERAMKDASAEIALKNKAHGELDKNKSSAFPAGTIDDLFEIDITHRKHAEPKTTAAENTLRQFLEFNPMFAYDKSLSAFENSDDARQAQNHFLDHHQIEIEQWLLSGNHRLVKDVELEKPLGIVVERSAVDFVSATTARIVLVRDGSVQGWHFLKSFLVA